MIDFAIFMKFQLTFQYKYEEPNTQADVKNCAVQQQWSIALLVTKSLQSNT